MITEYNLTKEQLQKVEELRKMTPQEWESLCKKCGICCLMKMESGIRKFTIYTDFCCHHFDRTNKVCTIYKDRAKELGLDCGKVSINNILDNELLPASCGYVEYVFGPAKYPAKIDFSKATPITDKRFAVLPFDKLLPHIIKDSKKWQR